MLPGLRFLFVAIVLSLSMMIFGLGAAALLRAAHEEVANLPTKPQPETVFAQQQTEAARPTLSMLSLDPPANEPNSIDRPAAPNPAPQPEQPAPAASIEPALAAEADGKTTEPEGSAVQTAALPTAEKSEAEKFETLEKPSEPAEKPSEAPAQTEPTARVEMPAPAPETRKTEMEAAPVPELTSTAATGTAAASSEPKSAPSDDSAKAASTTVATLGPAAATPRPTASKIAVTPVKRAQARHPVRRRHIGRLLVAPPRPVGQPAAPQPVPGQIYLIAQPGGNS